MTENDTVPGQLEEFRAEVRAELRAGRHRMDGIEQKLTENTAITMQVKDLLDIQATARVGYKFAWGVGKFIAWAGAAAGGITAIWAVFNHGPKP